LVEEQSGGSDVGVGVGVGEKVGWLLLDSPSLGNRWCENKGWGGKKK
jgi:hypothetical protein